jgi:hypothetical protein
MATVGVQCGMCGDRGVLRGLEADLFLRNPNGYYPCQREECTGFLFQWPPAAPESWGRPMSRQWR